MECNSKENNNENTKSTMNDNVEKEKAINKKKSMSPKPNTSLVNAILSLNLA
jgi:hypothetical protein